MTIGEILQAIKRSHVIAAIKQIDREGTVPKGRNSRKFSIDEDRTLYPPKYVLARAAKLATGQTLVPDDHSGGAQSNDRLRELGFTIVRRPSQFAEHA
jgi:hypothetical protein